MADGSKQKCRPITPTMIPKESDSVVNTTDLDLTGSDVEAPTYRTSVVVTPETSGLADGREGVVLVDRGRHTKLMLRCDAGSAVTAALGVSFGSSRTTDSGVVITGLRPDEFWLIGAGEAVMGERGTLPAEGLRSEVDLTHGRTLIEVSGPKAASMLEKVCGLDFSNAMTPAGAATSASVAKVSCDIVRVADSYLISCDRSFGQYLMESLADAAQEFGLSLGG